MVHTSIGKVSKMDKDAITLILINLNRILKIDRVNGTVTLLVAILPEQGNWSRGVLGLDGNIYFMPFCDRRILKIDPRNEHVCSVGVDLGVLGCKFLGAVLGTNGCILYMGFLVITHGLSSMILRVESHPMLERNLNTSFNGASARDGHIYVAKRYHGEVLKIDTNNNTHPIVGNTAQEPNHNVFLGEMLLWESMTLKYDPGRDRSSLVGNDFGDEQYSWIGGALVSDGIIYCIPYKATRVLTIDPCGVFTGTLASNMEQYLESLSLLFELDGRDSTHYKEAGTTNGKEKVIEVVVAICPSADETFAGNGMYPFMIAASYPQSELSIIYHLLRQTINGE